MIYFMATLEGESFIRIERPSIKPEIVIKWLVKRRLECVCVFKNGMIYDGYLLAKGRSHLRHKRLGGRRKGIELYKYLLSQDLPTEVMSSSSNNLTKEESDEDR